jgi:hypothetical protein
MLTVLMASVAARAWGDGAGEVVWADWLDSAEVWAEVRQVADGSSTTEPARLPPPELTLPPPEHNVVLRVLEPAASPVFERTPRDTANSGRFVRYEAPIGDRATHDLFAANGIHGELVSVPIKAGSQANSQVDKYSARVAAFFVGDEATPGPDEAMVVRYDVPVEEIALHTQLAPLGGEIIEPGALRLPEVRFFQPKARIYSDLKRSNDTEFDMFDDGALLASLDVVEFYFPMPLITERFARVMGRPSQLRGLGWRLGGTVGLGITTAVSSNDNASNAPISTLSAGIRYDFPLGHPSAEVLATRDCRLDDRTRVGIEGGVQGGVSTDEDLEDSTDLGVYLGILVNTPW